jgi:hypothetical protein
LRKEREEGDDTVPNQNNRLVVVRSWNKEADIKRKRREGKKKAGTFNAGLLVSIGSLS